MRKGFTLVELLVVIGIITILAAILFAVFFTVRDRSRDTCCQSNLRQLGMAILEYEIDSGNIAHSKGVKLDWVGTGGSVPGPEGVFVDQLVPETGSIWPAVKNRRVYKCPSDKWPVDVSYGINTAYRPGASIPSEQVLMADTVPGSKIVEHIALNTIYARRHHGGYNACFSDGHAKWLNLHPTSSHLTMITGEEDRF